MNEIKRLLLACIVCLMSVTATRSEVTVSVLTCSPGDEAYALYGHTALRYRDTSRDIDVVFNYGCFDFSTPNFVWRFVLGQTDYMVGCIDYDRFLPEYALRGSGVVEQVIGLSDDEARALFGQLLLNIKPENRVYRYRFLDNNCTTKVRDKLLETFSGNVSVVYGVPSDECVPVGQEAVIGKTYRELLALPSQRHPWYVFGINLLLGADVDKPLTLGMSQFLPLNFMESLDNMHVVAADSTERKVVRETKVLLQEQKKSVVHSNFTPFNASMLLLIATFVVMLCELRRRRTYWGIDVLLMMIQGLAGVLLLFMALFSEHPAVDVNWLVVLLNPLALVLLPFYVSNIRKHRPMKIAWVQVVLVALFLLTALLGLQVYPTPIFFCAAALLVRSLFHIYKDKICDLNIV